MPRRFSSGGSRVIKIERRRRPFGGRASSGGIVSTVLHGSQMVVRDHCQGFLLLEFLVLVAHAAAAAAAVAAMFATGSSMIMMHRSQTIVRDHR